MKALIAFFAKQRLFGNLLTVFIIVVGLLSLTQTRREVFPNVNFDIVTIQTIFPGASAEEIEKLVTNPIEQDLTEVDGIKKLRSVSSEGRSYIIAELDPDQTTEEKGKSDIQNVVDRFDRPDGVEQPLVNALNTKQNPIIQISLSGDVPELELRAATKELERVIERIPGVARASPLSTRDRELHIEVDPEKLRQNQLTVDDLVGKLRAHNVSIPAGTLESRVGSSGGEMAGAVVTSPERIVRTIGEFNSPKDVEQMVIRANDLGRSIRVKDVARVFYALEKSSTITRTNGAPAMDLLILKKEKGDAIKMVELVKAKIEEIRPTFNPKIRIDFVQDWSEIISNRISILAGNLLFGLFLVLVLLAALLPFRVALLTALGIPFSFLGAMIIFQWTDTTINLISLIGLIIVSGMLVDDAIVVNDNAMRHMAEGKDPETAAIMGTQEIWPSLTAAVLTTLMAFLPMMFMSGIFGKFVREIPIGVIAALLVSLFEGFFILPGHFAAFVKPQIKGGVQVPVKGIRKIGVVFAEYWDAKVLPLYLGWVRGTLKRRYLTCFAVLILFLASLGLGVKGLKFILFPPEGIEIFMVRAEAPDGTPLELTAELMRPIEREVAKLPEVELRDYVTTVGLQQEEPNDPFTKRGTHLAQTTIYLSPEAARERQAAAIIDELRERIGKPPGINRISFERMQGGPPVGKPISIGVWGREFSDIIPAVTALKKIVESTPGVQDVTDSYVKGREEIQIRVRSGEAEAAGLTPMMIGNTVRGAFDGIIATSIQELDEEVNLRVVFNKEARSDVTTLSRLEVPNARGNLVRLSSVASFEKGQGISTIEHEANQREIRVFAEVDVKVTSATIANGKIRERLGEIQAAHPKVEFSFGGEDKDTQDSLASLGRSFGVAFLGIFMILVLTLKSLVQPFLVVLTIPMGIIAVIWAFFLHGLPLSFMGSLGVVALAGVIVNNAIVYIDFVNQRRREGQEQTESLVTAAGQRLRPIFLTTLTTVVGLLPTAYGIGGIDRFVVPIAMSLGWGLMLGSTLVALTFPAAVAVVDDLVRVSGRLKLGSRAT